MKELVLGDSLEVLIDHRGKTPRKLGGDFVESGVPVASAILVKDGRLDLTAARCVSDTLFRRWMPVATKMGDVLLTSEAPLGRVARIGTDEPLVLGQRLFGLRGRHNVLDSSYLYYALQTEQVQSDLIGRSTGTTVTGIRQSALRAVRIPAPSYPEQVALAEVLGALDDKIAANRNQLEVAEHLADTIFALDAARHPSETVTFADVAEVGGGGTPRTSVDEYWNGDRPWATPTDVTALVAPYLDMTTRKITDAGLATCASALYPAGSILMTSRATIGAFAIAQVPMAVNQGFIVVNAKDVDRQWWLFHDMRSRIKEFLSFANGATFLELPRGRFKSLPVRIPSEEVVQKFNERVSPLHALAAALVRENRKLADTRDELLPLLMSGKIRVRDAERQAEDVL